MSRLGRRTLSWCVLLVASLSVPACASDGNFSILGYTTVPNYDRGIRTVYVPIFQNIPYRRGIEFDLTTAVIREIEAKTPYKVVSCREGADTELLGKVVTTTKAIINTTQLGEVREAQITLGVELVWRDLRPGYANDVISQTKPRDEPGAPSTTVIDQKKPPVSLATGTATFVPEVGGTAASATNEIVNRLAIQIVSMMEKGW